MKYFAIPTVAAAAGSLMLAFGASAGDDMMQAMDTNKDGMISAAEYSAGVRSKFGKLDGNADGRVTADEMDAAYAGTSGAGTASAGMSSADKIKSMDTDGDGALTAAEHESGSRAMFGKMDANGDGNLSAEELRAGHNKPTTGESG